MDSEHGNTAVDQGRRKFLLGAGAVVAVAATQVGLVGLLSGCKREEPAPAKVPANIPASPAAAPVAKAVAVALPWKYVALDPVACAERAYTAYYAGGCMFGAFEGIVGELREKVGPPYDTFPAAMAKYGKAGVSGWGTLCGALNGAAAATYLVADPAKGDGVIDELYAWYGAKPLPDYKPAKPKFDIKPSQANSPLCHISVTTWCETTKFKALSPERAERCAWLTASVAKHHAELLNSLGEGKVVAMPALSSEVQGCLACHGKGGAVENVHASKASTCVSCHEPHPPAVKK